MSIWRADCERLGRELPQPEYFRDAPKDAEGKLVDPTRGASRPVYPDGTFETAGMPPIFGSVCGSYLEGRPVRVLTPDEADDEHVELCFLRGCSPYQAWERLRNPPYDPGQRIADEIAQRYANRIVTNGSQLTAYQQQIEETAVELWLDSRIGRAAQARPDWVGAWDEWAALQETTRVDFRKAARKNLKSND